MFKLKTLVFAMSVLVSLPAISSNIALSKNRVDFDKNANTRDVVEVKSLDNSRNVYFKTILREVLDPQKGTNSQYSEDRDPSQSGIFVTPNKAVITPDQKTENISIINTNKNLEKERVYRLDVIPVIPKVAGEQFQAQMKVLLAYDVLIHVQPQNPTISHEYYFDNGAFFFKNSGNMHVLLSNGMQCNASDKCSPINTGKVFADKTVSVALNEDTTRVEYEIVTKGIGRENIVFKR